MRSDWRKIKLAELCQVFTDGDWIESKDQSQEGIRLVQTGNVGEGDFKNRIEKARWISDSTFSALSCTEVFPGDVLISRLPGPVGRACMVPELGSRLITGVDCSIVRLKPEIDANWFVHFCASDIYHRQIESSVTGTTRKRISRKNLGLIQVPLPPLEEQKRIAGILDEADRVRKKTQALIDKYDELAQSLFLDMFGDPVTNPKGWETRTLISLVDAESDLSYGVVQPGSQVEGGVPLVRPIDFTVREISAENCKKIEPAIANDYRRTELRGGELMLTVRGTVGLIALAADNLKGGNVSRGVVPFMLAENHRQDSEFFLGLFRNAKFLSYINKTFVKGATLKGWNLKDLRELEIPWPYEANRRSWSERSSSILSQLKAAERSLASDRDAFSALLQKAFKGELT